MMIKNEIGIVILRVVLGITFFIHGLAKFQGGIGNTVQYFDSLGVPRFLAYFVGIIELIGGIMLILGLGTKVVSLLLAVIMLGAIVTAKLPAGFTGNGQGAGYELDLALLAMSIFLVLANQTQLSLDSIIKKLSNK